MPLSTDITLPAEVEPVFPDRCVVCDCESRKRAKIAVDTQNVLLSFFVPILSMFGWKKIEFPVCEACNGEFFRQRWIRSIICWSIICVVVFVTLPYFKGMNHLFAKLSVIASGLAAIIPHIVFEVFFPRWFDVTASKHETKYEFRSEDYATDFYVLNQEAYPGVEIKIDDELV